MNLSRNLASGIAVFVLLGSGILYHALAQDSDLLEGAVARLPQVPMEVGDWKAHAVPQEIGDEHAFAQAGAKGYWVRSYVNQRTKTSVLVILMCGRAGKMAMHTPEVCYRGAGFELNDQPAVCSIKSELGETVCRSWTAQFTKKTVTTTSLRLYWAWNTRGVWVASAHPRWDFQGAPYLYKLYVSRDLGHGPSVAPQADPAADFLRQLVPALNVSLGDHAR